MGADDDEFPLPPPSSICTHSPLYFHTHIHAHTHLHTHTHTHARARANAADKEIATWMRANMKSQIIVTANKCERRTNTGARLGYLASHAFARHFNW
jgi:hypothetical protein